MQNLITIGLNGAWLRMREIWRLFFFLAHGYTDHPVGPTDAANGSNETSWRLTHSLYTTLFARKQTDSSKQKKIQKIQKINNLSKKTKLILSIAINSQQFFHCHVLKYVTQHIIWHDKLTQKFTLSVCHCVGWRLAAEYQFTHFNHFLRARGENFPKGAVEGKINGIKLRFL